MNTGEILFLVALGSFIISFNRNIWQKYRVMRRNIVQPAVLKQVVDNPDAEEWNEKIAYISFTWQNREYTIMHIHKAGSFELYGELTVCVNTKNPAASLLRNNLKTSLITDAVMINFLWMFLLTMYFLLSGE